MHSSTDLVPLAPRSPPDPTLLRPQPDTNHLQAPFATPATLNPNLYRNVRQTSLFILNNLYSLAICTHVVQPDFRARTGKKRGKIAEKRGGKGEEREKLAPRPFPNTTQSGKYLRVQPGVKQP